MEQRISRKDLYEASSETLSEEEEQKPVHSGDFDFEFEEVDVDHGGDEEVSINEPQGEDEEEAFEFNLFGNSQAVSLNETEQTIVQERPDSWYFHKTNDEEFTRIRSAALSGQAIITASNQIYYGMQLPNRVIDYTGLAKKRKIQSRKDKRRRPGKKSRDARKEIKANRKALRRPEARVLTGRRVNKKQPKAHV